MYRAPSHTIYPYTTLFRSQPANLQGIWNDQVRPPWSSNYTLNINAEMNYWPAEVCHLAECHFPLLEFIEGIAGKDRKSTRLNSSHVAISYAVFCWSKLNST